MVDKFGKELNIGDKVILIAPGRRILTTGTISEFTSNTATIEFTMDWNEVKSPNEFLKQKSNQLILMKGV